MNKLFVLGDSISIDYGAYLKPMMDGIMAYDRKMHPQASTSAEDQDHPDARSGANGGDSGMVLEYLESAVSSGRFDHQVLLLNCGLHDIKRNSQTGELQVPLDTYEANLHAILRLVEPLNVRIVWVRTTPVDDERHWARTQQFRRYNRDVIACNEAADRIMAEAGADIVDLYEFTRKLGEGEVLYCDHVHYNAPIRMQQAAFIAGRLYGIGAPGRQGKAE